MGEKIYINNPNGTKALRVLFKQDLDGASFVSTRQGVRRQDPHYTSGVGNRFFYSWRKARWSQPASARARPST